MKTNIRIFLLWLSLWPFRFVCWCMGKEFIFNYDGAKDLACWSEVETTQLKDNEDGSQS